MFSAVSGTCGMAHLLAKLPHNRSRPADLDATLAALTRRARQRAESPGSAGPADGVTDVSA